MSKPFKSIVEPKTLRVRVNCIQNSRDLDLRGDPLMKEIKLQTIMFAGYPTDLEEWIVDSLQDEEDSWTQLRPY